MKHILRAIVGPQAGEVIVLSSRTTLGRAADCDIQIVHEGVSRHHANFRVKGKSVELVDLSSDNGTYVNGERIDRYTLEPGDSVRVMSSRFAYEMLEDENPIATSPAYHRKVTSGDSLRRTGPVAIRSSSGKPGRARRKSKPSADEAPKVEQTAIEHGVPRTYPGSPLSRARGAGAPSSPAADPAAVPHKREARYTAGSSGMWRRSVEPSPSTRDRHGTAEAPVASASVATPEGPRGLVPPPMQRAATPPSGAEVATPRAERVMTEPPPVTSGSGAFRYPVDPNVGRSGESSGTFRPGRTGESSGRFGRGESSGLHPRPDPEPTRERIVPPAARGGSAAVPANRRAKPTAEVARGVGVMPDEEGSGPKRRTDEYGRADHLPTPASIDPRVEPEPGRRSTRNRVDAVGAGVSKIAAPGASASTTAEEHEEPSAEPSAKATGEFAPSHRRQTGAYARIPEITLDEVGPHQGVDHRAMGALTSELTRRTGPAPDDPSVEPEHADGRQALAAVLQYRDFRLRTLHGGQLTSVERRRYDHLDRYLQRTLPQKDNPLAAKRRFTRFACELVGELTHAEIRGLTTTPVAVYDIGAGGAKLDIGATELSVGDITWLTVQLAGIPDVPEQDADVVVFKARVVWVENAQLGLAFAGAPQYDAGAVGR